jgi:chromosome segregation ATPase
MSLDYQKLKQKQNGDEGSFWTSYSDLFMVLCVVFLLLYVVASLRSGTNSVQNQIENQKLKAESQDLKKQIQAYNALKDDYLEKDASPDEAKMYEELMSKLSLLQEEAHEEKRQLEAKAGENEAKAKALNQYQQMVRNIVNTNLLSNKKIKFRNEVIVKKNDEIKDMDSTIQTQTQDISQKAQLIAQNQKQIESQEKEIYEKQQVLDQKKQQVAMLESQVNEKAQTIQANQSKINSLNSDLSQKIKELEKTSTSANTSKTELNRKIAIMKLQNAKQIGELQNKTKEMKDSVETINRELANAEGQLQDARGKMAEQEALKQKLQADMAAASADHQNKMAKMRSDFDAKMNAERAALEKQLEGEKASAAEKVKRLGEFKDKIAGEKASLEKNLAALKDEVGKVKGEADNLKGQLATAQKEHGRYMAAVDQLQKDNAGLSGDLKKAQANLDAKKKLAKKIADNLAKNGIKAGVDGKTGDVTIQFGDEYFDTGRADLKPNMKQVLQKFVPTYSKSLLEDEKVAKEISSVEIVGFSSPTYQGRYVDPASLDIKDRAAVSYNLDLSYNRAKSIFNYMFDKNTMTYAHQKDMLPLVKVTGRSFLAEEVKGRNIASGLAIKDYCAQYNCEKSQKVIIRFNLKD